MAWQTVVFPLLLLSTTLCLMIYPTTSQQHPIFLLRSCNFSRNNYTENSPYHSNLLAAFSNLTSLSSSNTFSKVTVGGDEDATSTVYALYDCRNDLTLQTCHSCIKVATKTLLQECHSNVATVMYEECMLRYANHPIFAEVDLKPDYQDCEISIPDGGELNRIVEPMIEGLIDDATSVNSSRYFATGEKTYFEYQKVYSLVQCTPDLSREQCKECLMDALNHTLDCANSSLMVSYYHVPSCQMRYDVAQRFLNVSAYESSSLSVSPMASSPNLSSHLKTGDGGQRLTSIRNFVIIIFFFLYCLM